MAKDYAKRQTRKPTKRRKSSKNKKNKFNWKLCLLTLILLGLFIFALTLLNHQKVKIAKVTKKISVPVKKVAKKPQTTPQQPQFDFYTILPKEQINVTKLSATNNAKDQYFLQIGAMADDADADHLKAELSLLGFDVYTKKINKNNTVLTEINIGPYFSEQAAKADQKRLADNKIDSILKKAIETSKH
jgi:cell division protein FtsN